MSEESLVRALSCADDYDPDSMPVDKAQAFIRRFLKPVTALERVHLRAALGRVLGEGIISPIDVPAHDNSAMDGYAVRYADLADGASLRVAGTALAGRPWGGSLGAGEAVRIMTGAVIPAGADTIIMQEQATAEGEQVSFQGRHRQGQNLRRAGEDLATGQVVLGAGHLVKAADLGLLASLGVCELTVRRRLRVAFFSTGDELKSIGTPLETGDVYDSNRYTLFGMLTRMGVELIDMGVVRDDPASLEAALLSASTNADAIITSGGVSVGEADYIKGLLNRLGEVVFWKVAMKPGRPLAYGRVGQAHFFGLPGNPVAVMVTFYQFVREALQVLAGRDPVESVPALPATCVSAMKKGPGRTEFQRGILYRDDTGGWSVRLTGEQGSGILRSMSEANCFIVLPPEQGNVNPGDTVRVQLFEGLA